MQDQVQQRHDQILHFLRTDQFVSIRRLSERLHVSPLTVRRDLDALQAEGLVERVHGGAHVLERIMDQSEVSFSLRRGAQVAEKQAIAQAAIQMLRRDEVILVDASTTGLCFAHHIPEGLPLTLITYSALLPVELAHHPGLEIISTGGVLHRKSLCYLGEAAERALDPFHANLAFMGVKGVALDAGCTDAHLAEIQLKTKLLERASTLVLLADHTKLGNIGLASFAPLSRIHTLVTDAGADPLFLETVRAQGVKVIVAPMAGEGANPE